MTEQPICFMCADPVDGTKTLDGWPVCAACEGGCSCCRMVITERGVLCLYCEPKVGSA
jgi:hypothetical protein